LDEIHQGFILKEHKRTVPPVFQKYSSPEKVGCFSVKKKKFFAFIKMVSLIKSSIKNMKTIMKVLQQMVKNTHNMMINIIKKKAK